MFFKENLKKTLDGLFGGYRLRFEEKTRGLSGEYWVTLRDAQTSRVLDERHDHNIIVNTASILIARLLKDNKNPRRGYLTWRLGLVLWAGIYRTRLSRLSLR